MRYLLKQIGSSYYQFKLDNGLQDVGLISEDTYQKALAEQSHAKPLIVSKQEI